MDVISQEIATMEQELWDLIDSSASSEEIQQCFDTVQDAYYDTLDDDRSQDNRFHFINFHLKYLALSPIESTHSYIAHEIMNEWRELLGEVDLPEDLENNFLDAVKKGKIHDDFALTRFAVKLFEKGQIQKSIDYFESFAKPVDIAGYNEWARAYATKQDYFEALEVLDKGLEEYPDSSLLACNKAYYLHLRGRHNDAVEQLDEVLRREESNKYINDRFYVFAANLKADIYKDWGNREIESLMEYGRLSTAANSDKAQIQDAAKGLISEIEGSR